MFTWPTLGNKRIQVFDGDGNSKKQSPMSARRGRFAFRRARISFCTAQIRTIQRILDNGEIYKMELDGTVLGKFGRAGKLMKEFGTVNEIDCRKPNELIVGELINWRVQKLTLIRPSWFVAHASACRRRLQSALRHVGLKPPQLR